MEGYQDWSENDLIVAAQQGDSRALEQLLKNYQGLTHFLCEKYFLRDGDKEDLLQEAMIGFVEAVHAFKPENGKLFKNFALLCMKRELDSCIKKSNRKKHKILNEAVSIYASNQHEDDSNCGSYSYIVDKNMQDVENIPEKILVQKESMQEIMSKMDYLLSELEKKVLVLRINGHSYSEITNLLKLENKSVDNAVQRIRKKINFCREDIVAS